MIQPAGPSQPYRFGPLEIGLSTLAIIALGALIFVVLSITGWLVVILLVGMAPVEAVFETMKDRASIRTDPAAQLVFQSIGVLLYVAIGAAVVLIARMPKRMPLKQRVAFFDWTLDRHFVLVLLGTLVYALASGMVLEWIKPESRDWVALPKAPLPLFLAFFTIVVLGPFCEELLFRGWIFTALRTRMTFLPTLLLSSIVFAMMHFESSFLYALVVFPVGLVLGYVRERYGSIKASAIFHSSYNLFAFVVTFFDIA